MSGRLLGDQLPPTFEGTLRLVDGVVRGLPIASAQASLAIQPERIEVTALDVQFGDGMVSASGSYEPGEARYRGRMTLAEVSLDQGLRAMGWPAPIAGRVTGSVEGSGQGLGLPGLRLRLDLALRRLRAAEREAEARLVGRAEGGVLKVEGLTLGRAGSQVGARGNVNLATGSLALAVSGTIGNLAQDLWPWTVEGIGGRLSFSGQLAGTLKAPAFSGQLRGQRLSFKRIRLGSAEGPVEVEGGRIASRGIKVAVGSSAGMIAGEAKLPGLTLALKLEGRGRVEDVASWIPGSVALGGPFNLSLTASGTPKSLTGSGQVEVRDLRMGTERLESIRASLGLAGSELRVQSLTGRRRGITFRAEGQLALSGSYRFTLSPVTLDLATLAITPELQGTAVLSARGAGNLGTPQVEGEVVLADASLRDLPIGNGRLQFALEPGQWRWELGLDAGVRARGTASLALDRAVEAEVVATDFDLTPYLRALRQRLPFPLAVRADGSARLMAGLPDFRDLRGRIELTALRSQARETPFQLSAPTSITMEGGTLRFDALKLEGPELSVTVEGSVRPGERTDLELSGHAPFALVEPWAPPVAGVRGTPVVQVSFTGPPGQLRVTGRSQLRSVEVQLKPVPVWLSVTAGEVSFENDRVRYVLSEGAAAGGRLESQGTSELRGERWHHTFRLKLDKAKLEELYDQFQIGSRWASGDLFLRGSLGFETGPGLDPPRTLAGTLVVTLEGGSLAHYPGLVRIFGLLGSPAQPLRLPDVARERMPYRRISADFTVAKGVMETKNLVLDSEVVRVSGVGKVWIPEKTIDFDLGVRPLQVLEGGIRKVPLLGRLLPQEQALAVVYFGVKGPWYDPKPSLAPVKSLSQTVVDLLLFLLRVPDRLLTPP
ncbi:MAG: hypothetical protein HY724_00205 [Candidatus Rokubacteria bacterium]|nr:hypothetical protein [Candidatus Rokubacteria bacterium]